MAQAVENRGPVVLTITIVFLVLSTAVVTLRLVSRIGIVKKFHWEDGFIVLAWVSEVHVYTRLTHTRGTEISDPRRE
jgi:hypothetical protein